REEGCQCRGPFRPSADRCVPGGERSPPCRIWPAPVAAGRGASGFAVCTLVFSESRFGRHRIMKIGSDEHKQRFCHDFIASHCQFEPAALSWPDLDAAELERLRAIPFWQEVLYTERRAGAIVAAYAATIADPLVREAVTLQGFEEARHAELLRLMIHRYGIIAEERLPEPLSGDL